MTTNGVNFKIQSSGKRTITKKISDFHLVFAFVRGISTGKGTGLDIRQHSIFSQVGSH